MWNAAEAACVAGARIRQCKRCDGQQKFVEKKFHADQKLTRKFFPRVFLIRVLSCCFRLVW
jgi:hypothetical protein